MFFVLDASFECLRKRVFVGEVYFAAGGDASAEAGEFLRVPLKLVLDDHGIEIAVRGWVGGDNDLVSLSAKLVLDSAFQVVHAQPLCGIENAAFGKFADDEVSAFEFSCPLYGHEIGLFFDDHDSFLGPVGIFANVAQGFLVGVDKEAVRANLDRSEFDDCTCGFIYFAFAAADQKKSEPRRLARTDTGELCKYVDEVFYLIWKHILFSVIPAKAGI